MRDWGWYVRWVFEAKKRFGVSVLNYMVTSNHIHLLVRDTGGQVIAQIMHAAEYLERSLRLIGPAKCPNTGGTKHEGTI